MYYIESFNIFHYVLFPCIPTPLFLYIFDIIENSKFGTRFAYLGCKTHHIIKGGAMKNWRKNLENHRVASASAVAGCPETALDCVVHSTSRFRELP